MVHLTSDQVGRLLDAAGPGTTVYLVGAGGCGMSGLGHLLLDLGLRGQPPDIREHVRAAPIIPDTADALDVVDIIKQTPIHMGLVHDEYGHFEGIITNADILESIVGA